MHYPLKPLIELIIWVIAWLCQILRWSRVASRVDGRRAVVRVFALWVFPPASSAFAVTRHASLVSRTVATPVRAASQFLAQHLTRRDERFTNSRIVRPASFTLVAVVVLAMLEITRAPQLVIVATCLYGIVFPWGMPIRRRRREPSERPRTGLAIGATLVAGAIFIAGYLLGLMAEAFVVTIVGAPLLVTVLLGHHPNGQVSGRVVDAVAPNGALIVDATRLSSWNDISDVLDEFLARPVSGQRLVVTPGVVEGAGHTELSYRMATRIDSNHAQLIAVGRLNAAPLIDGANGAIRVDTFEQSVRWINEHVTTTDAVLYLGELPDHLP